ncbi:uncharacterized protein LOC124170874 isoform X2 [Ischnura elegans]|uniref:uncharacterized protein LOC124170874 isoform X2 n=1 Tax=Ischnura elegans TaxID=197161 RepID=UPI001ED8811D|nr:uncharacterized protein LOC124170874 isoform X2 [Ischnura elegans]
MVDCNAIIEGAVKIRDGKKWKSRWCLMTKLSPVADCLHLQLYRDSKDRWKLGQAKTSLSLQHFLGIETGFTLDKESNTIAIICQDSTVILGFDSRERLVQWQVKIAKNLGEGQKFTVQIVSAPPKSKLPLGPARLHVRDHCFSLTSGLHPRVLGSWNISHLRRYGVVDGGRFCFEGGSRCGKGEGVHVLATADGQGEVIAQALRLGSQGRLLSLPAQSSPTLSRHHVHNFSAESPQRHVHSMMSDVGYGDGLSEQHAVLCSSNARLVQSLGEMCSERGANSSLSACRMSTMRPTVESWAWNSSMESCFSPSTSHWCFSLHHHVHHHPCNISLRTSNAPGPSSPPIPVHGHEGAIGGEVSGRDMFAGFVTDGEGRGGALMSGAGDGTSICSQGSGGESEYCVPARYTPCTQAKSNSSSSSASTASNSTCSSLSCSWYDKPKPGQVGGVTSLATGDDSSHMVSPSLPRVAGGTTVACAKHLHHHHHHHHHHHASAMATNSGDNVDIYDTPKNVASHSCAAVEGNHKSVHHLADNPCHSSAGMHCEHYDTPRKFKEALSGVCPSGASGSDHVPAAGNYDIPLRFHHIPCCCAGHNAGSSNACSMQHDGKGDGRQGSDEKCLTVKSHRLECSDSHSPSPVRMSMNESSALDMKSAHKSRCGVVSMSDYYKYPNAQEISHCMSRSCCHAESSCCMGNWPVGMGKAENREHAKFKSKSPGKSSNLYENLNFAQSLEHYENLKELLVRSDVDSDRDQTGCLGMQDHGDSGSENHPSGTYHGGNSSQNFSQLIYEKDGVKLCKKCGHSFWCPLKDMETRPCNASGELYSNLSVLNQSLAGACNTDTESAGHSPKRSFLVGRVSEKSASIPSLHHVSSLFENRLLPHKSRYHVWRHSSAPALCKAEENFSSIWDFSHQQLGVRGHRNLLGEDLFSMVGYYPCTCRDLMTGCIQRGKRIISQSGGKFTPHLQSTGPTSLNSSVVSSTTASAVSLQLPSSSRTESCLQPKNTIDDNNTLPSSAEECAEPSSSCHQAAAESNKVHAPANNAVQIVRRSSAHPGRPIAAGNGGNRDSSGSNDSGVSSTGSVGGGGSLVPAAAPPQCPNRPPSPSHSRCRRSRVLTHPSPWCFHASLPHPRSTCSLRSSSVHSHPHLETLRSRSCSDPLRTLACSSPSSPSSGMAVMATCSESSDSSGSVKPKD